MILGENVYSCHHKDKTGVLSISPTFDGKRTIPSEQVSQLMLNMLALKPGDKVLEIGTGSGSQTKIFARTGAEIHSIELEPWLDAVNLDGNTIIYLHSGDGKIGLEQEAPFSAIVATCGVSEIPQAWCDQISENGHLVAPVGDAACQRLTLFRKEKFALIPVKIAAYVRFQMLREQKRAEIPRKQAQS